MRDEIAKVIGFWLELGQSGFRVDPVPFFLETAGNTGKEAQALGDPHAYLRWLRTFLGRRTGSAILLGEVNLPHEQPVPDEDMQLYGRGLPRRLPPMLDGDPPRIRLVYSLLFALPGMPTHFYGEEIGMGENLTPPAGCRCVRQCSGPTPATADLPRRRPPGCPGR